MKGEIMADDYLTMIEFVPGTKAKAQEVNTNFSTLKDAINKRASMNGDSTQNFKVAAAAEASHAPNKGQLDDLAEDLAIAIKKTTTNFCVKSGNTTNGKGDLFSYEVLKITPKIGGTYKKLVISNYEGIQTTISSAAEISMVGQTDGEYNIFIKPDGTFYILKNKIYKQPARPALVEGDIWFNTGIEPFYAVKYSENKDNEFLDLPLGMVTITSGAISALETFPFNQNGHNVTTQTALKSGSDLTTSIMQLFIPDYINKISKVWGTRYTAESNGFLVIGAGSNNSNSFVDINGTSISIAGGSGAANMSCPTFILAKGDVYQTSGVYGSITFFPMKSV